MGQGNVERRLAAVLAADVCGYSGLVAQAEVDTLSRFTRHMAELVRPAVTRHGGRIFKEMGDGLLAEFASPVSAVNCALEIQRGMRERNCSTAAAQAMEFRIGVHVADVVIEGEDLLGEGVNLAARLEGVAEPGGICVSARVQEDVQGRVEAGFEDAGEQTLKNIPRPVRTWRVVDAVSGVTAPRPESETRPSIAVLPLTNMSGDEEQEYFADALTEDLTTALSRWRWFFVIARNSAMAFKGRATDMKRVGSELGVRYLLEGSVRKVGERVRVTLQLIDARDGCHIWADRFDRDLVDILALQDEITEMVVGAIEPAMLRVEGQISAHKNITDYTAFDCFQRGMWQFNKMSPEGHTAALELFRKAIARDPQLALGLIGLSRTLYAGATFYGWSADPDRDLQEAYDAAREGLELDPRDAHGYFALAGAALYLGRHDEALEAARRTLALNPGFALGHSRLGQVLIYIGRPAEAIEPIERSLRYSPFDPQLGAMLGSLSLAYYQARKYAEAVTQAQAAIQHRYGAGYVMLAAGLARLGRLEEARRALPADLLERTLRDTPRLVPYANDADRMHLLEGLWLAGVGAAAPVHAD